MEHHSQNITFASIISTEENSKYSNKAKLLFFDFYIAQENEEAHQT